MNTLLTDEDLIELTGVEQPSAQARVLREHGLSPIIRRDGRPRITWEAITAANIGRGLSLEPDWSATRARA